MGNQIFKRETDINTNGFSKKVEWYKGGNKFKETFLNKEGKVNSIVYYDENGVVTIIESATNRDGKINARDEFYKDLRSKSLRDTKGDGKWDKMWITYFDEKGNKIKIDYDINNDRIFDSKMDMLTMVRQNNINGVWCKDVMQGSKHGIMLGGEWKETIFEDGDWKIKS